MLTLLFYLIFSTWNRVPTLALHILFSPRSLTAFHSASYLFWTTHPRIFSLDYSQSSSNYSICLGYHQQLFVWCRCPYGFSRYSQVFILVQPPSFLFYWWLLLSFVSWYRLQTNFLRTYHKCGCWCLLYLLYSSLLFVVAKRLHFAFS